MKLIIAEKPSLARNIAAAIGKFSQRKGYLEGEEYLVTWAFGHLFSLCDIEEYTGATSTGRWSMENIPCFPEKFCFTLRRDKDGKTDSGVAAQFETIKALCLREDVQEIINAGDADREGEIIIRLCLMHTGEITKPVSRLWLPDQTPETVRAALGEMKSAAEYDNLSSEGFARTYMDWLYGVNLTRFATLKSGTLLRVGRVIVPIVKAIYDRDLAIENFEPETYFAVSHKEEETGIELVSKKKFKKEEEALAREWAEKLNATPTVVKKCTAKKDQLNPGKLYSLSKLQNALGKKHKMPMEDSLRIVQTLYEKGYVTYPRTNSEYLATAEKDKIKTILANLKKIGYPVEFKDGKTIFDDSKIESHSALTPTYKIPSKEALSEEEELVYRTILYRFLAVFCSEKCLCQKTQLVLQTGELEEFTLKGTVILQKGWMRFDDSTRNDKILPELAVGDVIPTAFAPREKETSPPKHYTIETLNNYLKNPFREEKARADEEETDDAEDYKAMFEGLELGTEATRTGIIENALKSRYINLKKDVYSILPDGRYLIEQLTLMGISMDKFKTATTGKALKAVFRGEMKVEEAVGIAAAEIREVFSGTKACDTGFYRDEIGTCPVCGKSVVKGKYAYGCSGFREGCPFRINFVILGRPVSIQQAKKLLSKGKTDPIEGFVSKKTGKSFSAALKWDGEKIGFEF